LQCVLVTVSGHSGYIICTDIAFRSKAGKTDELITIRTCKYINFDMQCVENMNWKASVVSLYVYLCIYNNS